jgi:peptidyl-prolyl cis-trans isomerase SurA
MKERRFALRRSARIAAVSAALAFAAGCGGMKMPFSMPHLPRMPWQKTPRPPSAPPPAASAPISYQSSAPATPNSAYGSPIDSIIANVDGSPITSYDVKTFTAAQPGAMGGLPQSGGAAPDSPDAVLKALITQQLLDIETQHYADKVDDDDINRYIQNVEERNHITDDQLRAQLQSQGMSYEQFRQRMRKQVEQMTMLDHEVRQKIRIPDAEIERYYKAHPDQFTVTEEKYTLAQILIAVPPDATPDQIAAARKKAAAVLQQVKKGKDFGDLAREYSDDDSKSKGGELGSFSPNDLNEQIAAAIKNVKPGGITDLVHTKYGFHIVKVEDHQTPGVKPLDEVKDGIRDQLMTEQSKDQFQKWIDQDLARQHYVETNQ